MSKLTSTDRVLPMEYTEKVEALRFVKLNGRAVAEWCGGDIVTTSAGEVVCMWVEEGDELTKVMPGSWIIRRMHSLASAYEVVTAENFRERFTVVP